MPRLEDGETPPKSSESRQSRPAAVAEIQLDEVVDAPLRQTVTTSGARDVDINQKTYEEGKAVKTKTPQEAELIELALHRTPLFTCLDEEQINRFVVESRLLEFEQGEVVFSQGDKGYDCFIIEEGSVEVLDVSDEGEVERLGIRVRGNLFGEGSMIFHRRRSATVKAKEKLKAWVMNDRVFVDKIMHSQRIIQLFNKYASLTDESGERVMTMDDFVRSCNDTSVVDVTQYSQLRSLYRIVRGDQEFVSLKDFSLFNMFMTRPDPEYEIAFLLFDERKQGFLTLDDVRAFLASHATNFNYDCDLIKRFFGPNGNRRVRVDDFSLFFDKLQVEMSQQAFIQMDPQGVGMVSLSDFFELLSNFGRRSLPDPLVERIAKTHELRPAVSFTDFLAYQSIFQNLPSLHSTIKAASHIKNGPLSKDDFKVATMVLNRRFSRVESDLVFELFDLDGDGFISPDDCRFVLGNNYIKELRAIYGRGGALTFAPPPGYDLQHRRTQLDAPRKGSTGGETLAQRLKDFCEGFVMGSIAGGVGAFAVYPIDLVKTRMQNQRSGKALALANATGVQAVQYKGYVTLRIYQVIPQSTCAFLGVSLKPPYEPAVTYQGLWSIDCFRQILAKEGPIGLYRGLAPQLVGVAPEKAIKLTVNDLLRDMFTNHDKVTGVNTIYFPLEVLAGCGAGASQVVFTNPLEITKIRLQMQGETAVLLRGQGLPLPPLKKAWQIVKELGFVGLYKGATACFLRDIPFSGIYFPAYAAAKRWVSGGEDNIRPHHLLLAGAMAGVPAASLTTPADVIKTRLQVVAREGEMTYDGITDCALKIYKNEGLSAFFKGALMRVMRSSPQFGVTLLAYEGLRMLLSSELEPRPPTNAPITQQDYDAFRRQDLTTKADNVNHLIWGAGKW